MKTKIALIALFLLVHAFFISVARASDPPMLSVLVQNSDFIYTWDASPTPDIDEYVLCFGFVASDKACVEKSAGKELTLTVTNLQPGQTYQAWITAWKDGVGSVAIGPIETKLVKKVRTSPPTNFDVNLRNSVASALRAATECCIASIY